MFSVALGFIDLYLNDLPNFYQIVVFMKIVGKHAGFFMKILQNFY